MMRWISLSALLVLPACGSKTTYDPFVAPETEVYKAATVVALAPFPEPQGIGVPDSVLQLLERLIDSVLTTGGFATVPDEEFAHAWNVIVEDLGGVYDPMTGRLDNDKYRIAEERLARDLNDRFGANAFLYPELVMVDAGYADGKAKWDGASQSVASFWDHVGEALSALANGLSNVSHTSTYPSGTITAVSLRIGLYDLEGTELYTNWAGIEVVADKDDGSLLPEDRRFRETDRIRQSVQIALGPLVERKLR